MYLELLVEMGLDVKFLPADFRRVEPYSTELNRLGIETLDGDWYRENWETWLKDNGSGIDYAFFHKPDPTSRLLPIIKSCTNAAIIYQCHDLHYLRLRRKAEVENDQAMLAEAERYEQKEDFIFANSDVLLTFSDVEEKIIRKKFPLKQVFTVPLFFYMDAPDPGEEFTTRRDLLYVGSCSHTPNQDAIAWFSSEILPLVQKEIPDIVFHVVGANPPPEISSLQSKNIRIHGRVSDDELRGLYQGARIVVAPLRFGAGVKGKVIEALYHGLPLVSTTIGLEGIKDIEDLTSPRDTARDFAAEVVSLYKSGKRLKALSARGSKFVKERFTGQAASSLMTEILDISTEESVLRLADAVPVTDEDRYTPPRLISFYLPQYHPIPENDEWWGEGFTDWRNVSAAKPLFTGHYQPHVPADLGYYDLRQEETRIAQAELAKQYGIEGFCYYHYWFNGKMLLEQPLQEVLKSGKPDLPFCICWANENWTRRWDGHDDQVLIRQEYNEEDDRDHIRSLLPFLKDDRYIRINGKLFLLIYRTENLPDPARTAEIWREEVNKAGLGELFLCRVESFSKCVPGEIGFDAAVEFAPDWANTGPALEADSEQLELAKEEAEKVCRDHFLYTYQSLADTMMAKQTPPYKWFRCVTPSWDNTARRKKGAYIFNGSSPEKYQSWLTRAIEQSNQCLFGEERIVFINAWNEWAEGNHLEPDKEFGTGYLEATKKALELDRLAFGSGRSGSVADARIRQMASQLANYKHNNLVLEEMLEQRDQQIEDMLNSTSWRMAAPVRWAKRRLLGLKKLFTK